MQTVRYITGIPRKPLPPDQVVVHNHIRPVRPIGLNGFRAWIATPGVGGTHYRHVNYEVERCDCAWAPELPEHYRVKRNTS